MAHSLSRVCKPSKACLSRVNWVYLDDWKSVNILKKITLLWLSYTTIPGMFVLIQLDSYEFIYCMFFL